MKTPISNPTLPLGWPAPADRSNIHRSTIKHTQRQSSRALAGTSSALLLSLGLTFTVASDSPSLAGPSLSSCGAPCVQDSAGNLVGPAGRGPFEGNVVPPGTPLINVAIRWTGLAEAPAMVDPGLVCENNFKNHLWRRHEIASDTIWIPEAKITLRSAAMQDFHPHYRLINDLDTTIGVPGDITIDPTNPMAAGSELLRTYDLCEQLWAPQSKGVLAVSAGRILDPSGRPGWKALALRQSLTRPFMVVADATLNCQPNERALARAFGSVLGLANMPLDPDNLMNLAGTGAKLTLAQCNQARTYLSQLPAGTRLDPPNLSTAPVNFVADVLDVPRPAVGAPGHLDITKYVVIDETPSDGNLTVCLATAAPIPTGAAPGSFWMLLDVDNNPRTGGTASDLVPGAARDGVDLVGLVTVNGAEVHAEMFQPGEFGTFVPVVLEPGDLEAKLRTIDLVLIEPISGSTGLMEVPVFDEIELSIHRSALERLGIKSTDPHRKPEGLFPRGLASHARATSTEIPHPGPDPTRFATTSFPRLSYPVLEVNEFAAPGQFVVLRVYGMPPSSPLKVILGEAMSVPSVRTDENGSASFDYAIPANARVGRSLITVGVDDPHNAVTADAVVEILGVQRQTPELKVTLTSSNTFRVQWQDPYGQFKLMRTPDLHSEWIPVLARPDETYLDRKSYDEPMFGNETSFFKLESTVRFTGFPSDPGGPTPDPTAVIKIDFLRIDVKHDGDNWPSGDGEIYYEFQVDNDVVVSRSPSNAVEVGDGESVDLANLASIIVTRNCRYGFIWIYGSVSEEDDFLNGGDDHVEDLSDLISGFTGWNPGLKVKQLTGSDGLEVSVTYRITILSCQ